MRNNLLSQLLLAINSPYKKKVWNLLGGLLSVLFVITASYQTSVGQTYPFPQNYTYQYGTMPVDFKGTKTAQAKAAYDAWKKDYVTKDGACGYLRVKFDFYPGTKKGAEDGSLTVSEGIGYGMLLAAYAGDREVFDGLWKYYQKNTNGSVMNWMIKSGCVIAPGGANGATDAELDVTMSLIVASHQWQSDAYLQDAKNMIKIIREKEFEQGTKVQKPGDKFGGSSLTNPSYFAPAYYRVFATLDPGFESFWTGAAAVGYQIIEKAGGTTGLVPDWCTDQGTASSGASQYEVGGKAFNFDAIRTPLRSAVDYLWFGTPEARAYCDKITTFIRTKTANDPTRIAQRYGTKVNGNEGDEMVPGITNTFVGCFGVGTMAATSAGTPDGFTFLNKSVDVNINKNPPVGEYFNATIKAITLFIETGNFYLPPPDKCETPNLGTAQSLCQGATVKLTAGFTEVAPRTFTWKLDGKALLQTTQSIDVSAPGLYEVIAVDAAKCTRRAKVEVFSAAIVPNFVAKVGPGSVLLTNTTTGGVSSYSWTIKGPTFPAAGQEFSTEKDAIKSSLQSGSYNVTLTQKNNGFAGCSSTVSLTKTVIIGAGIGWAFDDFNDTQVGSAWVGDGNGGMKVYDPLPKINCSYDDYKAGNPAVCPNNPCGLFVAKSIPKTTAADLAARQFTPFGVTMDSIRNLSTVPFVSLRVMSTKDLTLGVGLNELLSAGPPQKSITSARLPGALKANEWTVLTFDFSKDTVGYDVTLAKNVPMHFTKCRNVELFPFEADPTWDGTITVDWVIVGAKALSAPKFDYKKDALGFLVYEDPDGDKKYTPVSSWSRIAYACTGPKATVEAKSCNAEIIRWYKGTSVIYPNSATAELEEGKYYVELINASGITRDSIEVKGAQLKAAFSYNTDDNGKSLRLFNDSRDFTSFKWNYGVPVSDSSDYWLNGYHYYPNDGKYNVCLKVENTTCKNKDSVCTQIDVKCFAPLGQFVGLTTVPVAVNDTITICAGKTVTFTLDSVAYAKTYGWYGISPNSYGDQKTLTKAFDVSQKIKIEAYNICGQKAKLDSVNIKVRPKPKAEFTLNPISGQSYAFVATPVLNEPNAQYLWYVDGSTTPLDLKTAEVKYTFTSQGTHSVKLKVITDCGEAEQGPLNIGCNSPVLGNATINAASLNFCENAPCALFSVDGLTNADQYTWTWTLPGASTPCTPSTTSSINANIKGTGKIVAKASTQCGGSAELSLDVTFTPSPVTPDISVPVTAPSCNGADPVEYKVLDPSPAGATYTWSYPEGAKPFSGQGTSTFSVLFGGTNGPIKVIKKVGSCIGKEKSVTVELRGCDLKAAFTSSSTEVCEGVEVSFVNNSTGTTSSAKYQWNFGAGAVPATLTTADKLPVKVKYTGAGEKTISLTIIDGNTVSATGTLMINPLPGAVTEILGEGSPCGSSVATFQIAAVNNATGYTWTGPAGAVITKNAAGTSAEVKFGTIGGEIKVVPTNSCGKGDSSKKIITLKPSPVAATIEGIVDPGCNGAKSGYSVPATVGSVYTWTKPDGAVIEGVDNGAAVSILFGTSNGDITVIERNSAGCSGPVNKKTVTLKGCDLKADFKADLLTACEKSTVVFTDLSTVSGSTATYQWSFGEGAEPLTATGKGPQIVVYKTPGSKTVKLTVTDGATKTVEKANYIVVNPLPAAASVINGSPGVCANAIITYSTPVVANANSYTWSAPGAEIVSGQGTNEVKIRFGKDAGSVSIVVKPSNGCGDGLTKSLNVKVNPLPLSNGISGTDGPTCSQQSIVYSTEGGAGSTFKWTVPEGATIVGSQTGSGITVNFGSKNGEITVQETTASGCIGAVQRKAIVLKGCALAADFKASNTSVCDGAQVVFQDLSSGATGTTVYNWDFGTGATPATATTQGPHTVTYKGTGKATVKLTIQEGDGEPKTETKTDFITINPKPGDAGLVTGASPLCPGSESKYWVPAISNATSYRWSAPGATIAGTKDTASVTFGTTSGEILLRVAGVNGCGEGKPSIKSVVIHPTPEMPEFTGDFKPVCSEPAKTYQYKVSAVNAGSVYRWSVPSEAKLSEVSSGVINVVFGTKSGKITVYEEAATTCRSLEKAHDVTIYGCGMVADFSADKLDACVNSDVTFKSTSTASSTATYSWDFGTGAVATSTTGVGPIKVKYSTTGFKTVKVTVTDGPAVAVETKVEFVNVSDKPADATALIKPVTEICQNGSARYLVNEIAGAYSYKWTVPSGAVVSDTTNNPTIKFGTLGGAITVAGKNNCGLGKASTAVTVAVNSAIVPKVSAVISSGSPSIKQGQKVIFTANATNGGATPEYSWYVNDTLYAVGPTYTSSSLKNNDNVYVKLKSSIPCATPTTVKSDGITMTVEPRTPGFAIAGDDQLAICGTSATLAATQTDCGTGSWIIVNKPTTATDVIILNPGSPNAVITGLVEGTYTLQWKVQGACGTKSDDMVLKVIRGSVTVSANKQIICFGSSVKFTATPSTDVYKFQWKLDNANVGLNQNTFETTQLKSTSNVRVEIWTSTCENTAVTSSVISVKVDTTTEDPNPGEAQSIVGTTGTLAAIKPAPPTKGSWSLVSGSGKIANDTLAITEVTDLSGGVNIFKWTVQNGVCPAKEATVALTVGTRPSTHTVTGPDKVAVGDIVTYSVTPTSGSSYSWLLPAGVEPVNPADVNSSSITVKITKDNVEGAVSVTETNDFGSNSSSKLLNSTSQNPQTQEIAGKTDVKVGAREVYSIKESPNSYYRWIVPAGAKIISGWGTNNIVVEYLSKTNGQISVVDSNSFGTATSVKSVQTVINPVGTMDQVSLVSFDLYPNPFADATRFRINYYKNAPVSVKVFDTKGVLLDQIDKYSANEDILFGNTLPKGLYTIQVNFDGMVEHFKLVKVE